MSSTSTLLTVSAKMGAPKVLLYTSHSLKLVQEPTHILSAVGTDLRMVLRVRTSEALPQVPGLQ